MNAAERIERELKDIDLEMESEFQELERLIDKLELWTKSVRYLLSKDNVGWVPEAGTRAEDMMRAKIRIDTLRAKREVLARLHTDLLLV